MLTFLKTYHAMCFDHLLPIFFEDDRAVVDSVSSIVPSSLLYFPGGLGLSIPTVGMISKYPICLAHFLDRPRCAESSRVRTRLPRRPQTNLNS